jgi:hypothetical protein
MDSNSVSTYASAAMGLSGNILQNAFNRQNQAEMNRYNSPAQQMQRYRDAGLNPNLIYGQGTPGNQPAPLETQQPFSGVDAQDSVRKYVQTTNEKAQNKVILNQARVQDAQIREIDARAHNEDMQSMLNLVKGRQLQSGEPWWGSLAKTSNEAASQRLQNLIKDYALKEATRLNLGADLGIKGQVFHQKDMMNKFLEKGIMPGDSQWTRGLFSEGLLPYLNQKFEQGSSWLKRITTDPRLKRPGRK